MRAAVAGSLDPDTVRVAAYLIAAGVSLHVGWRERALPVSQRRAGQWPAFLFMTAAVLTVMAVGVSGHVDDWVADVGRRRARADGWYDRRRDLQAALVVSVGVTWFASTAVAIWRVPDRRRRYLPSALVVFTAMCFAGVRVVSLHHVDAALSQWRILGAKIGLVIELFLLGLAMLATYWHPFGPRADLDVRAGSASARPGTTLRRGRTRACE